jgi:hypothetical protein
MPDDMQGAAPEAGGVSKEDKTMAMLAHLLGIVTSFIGALIIWLVKKDESPFVDDQGKEALNFQITILIAYAVATVLSVLLIGFLLYPIIWIANLILCILAGIKANEGQMYRYPFALRLIK